MLPILKLTTCNQISSKLVNEIYDTKKDFIYSNNTWSLVLSNLIDYGTKDNKSYRFILDVIDIFNRKGIGALKKV